VDERWAEIVCWTLSGRAIHCLVGLYIVWLEVFENSKLKVGPCLGQVRHCLVGLDIVRWEVSKKRDFLLKSTPFFPSLILELYRAPTQMKLGHKGHLSTRNKFPKEVFLKSNDFPSDFGWTQKPRFWGNEEKSMKSKGLESWIHSKVGGIWWGSS
jgi:hypothetical protein